MNFLRGLTKKFEYEGPEVTPEEFFEIWTKYDTRSKNHELSGPEIRAFVQGVIIDTDPKATSKSADILIENILKHYDIDKNKKLSVMEMAKYFKVEKKLQQDNKDLISKKNWNELIKRYTVNKKGSPYKTGKGEANKTKREDIKKNQKEVNDDLAEYDNIENFIDINVINKTDPSSAIIDKWDTKNKSDSLADTYNDLFNMSELTKVLDESDDSEDITGIKYKPEQTTPCNEEDMEAAEKVENEVNYVNQLRKVKASPQQRQLTKNSPKQDQSLLKHKDSGKTPDSRKYEAKPDSSSQFTCGDCGRNLMGYRYILRENNPYCVQCYEDNFANICSKCTLVITVDSKDMSYKDKHWHEKCFSCQTCGKALADQQFGTQNQEVYCADCYDESFAARCSSCDKAFKSGSRKLEWRGKQCHEECLVCCKCEEEIGTKSFIPKDNKPYCVRCYEESFGTKCTSCSQVITTGGVTYKGCPYHRECFVCSECSVSLAGQRFTTREEKPYCAECHAKLYAPRCKDCKQPITGIGGTKFISFEGEHWHNECFVCHQCDTSLVGRGFLADGESIMCPDCGRT